MFILTKTLCAALKLEHFDMGKAKMVLSVGSPRLLRFIALRMF